MTADSLLPGFNPRPAESQVSRRTRLPAPWRRVDDGVGKLGARYALPSGWWIEHCGHPTALWPYLVYSPAGERVLAPNGRAWRSLELAAAEAMRREAGRDGD